jgi:hypothetical protein
MRPHEPEGWLVTYSGLQIAYFISESLAAGHSAQTLFGGFEVPGGTDGAVSPSHMRDS